MKSKSRRAFTLIELLVVIAILAVLAAMLLPALGRAKQSAWSTRCMNHFKQIGVAMVMYADEHEDSLPLSSHEGSSWVATLQPYCGGTALWRCPRDPHMKPFIDRCLKLASGLALCVPVHLHAQHSHLEVGAAGTSQNDPLLWDNGGDFVDTSGYVKTLEFASAGRYAGHYQGGITLTVLPATELTGGPDPDAPALGSFIQFRMACLEGPKGGVFHFWESTGVSPVASLAPGESGTNLWPLSQSDGSAGSDPFGHIHGRRFTATKPGMYKIEFTAVDTSSNGAGSGPIHTDSTSLPVWFQAGVNVMAVEPDVEKGQVRVQFGAQAGYVWQVEFSPDLGPEADWQPAGDGERVIGMDHIIEWIHDLAPGERRYYRLQGEVYVP